MLKGEKHTEEWKCRISELMKGNKNSLGKKNVLGYKHSNEHKMKISESQRGEKNQFYGKHHTKETRRKLSEARIGQSMSEEIRKKISESTKGEKSHFWKGGITPKNEIIRHSIEYRLWREAVYKRDDYTCRMCNKKGGRLHPHHLWDFAKFPELRFAINNGMTLCLKCHGKLHGRKFYK